MSLRRVAGASSFSMMIAAFALMHCSSAVSPDVGTSEDEFSTDPCRNDKPYTFPDANFSHPDRYICGDYAKDYCECRKKQGTPTGMMWAICTYPNKAVTSHAFNVEYKSDGTVVGQEPQNCTSTSDPASLCQYGTCTGTDLRSIVAASCPGACALRWKVSASGVCPQFYTDAAVTGFGEWESVDNCTDGGTTDAGVVDSGNDSSTKDSGVVDSGNDSSTKDAGTSSTDSGSQDSGLDAAKSCTVDGECNPGNNGSGLICTKGKCVPGCRYDNQCPNTMVCSGGQCSEP